MSTLPWHRPELIGWSIVGMNHYHVQGERRLYVSMVWNKNICIIVEGIDGPELWDELAHRALAAEIDSRWRFA